MRTDHNSNRTPTGVPGLDDVLDGGYPGRKAVLVTGKPGTGKTILGLQFLLAGIRERVPGLYVSCTELVEHAVFPHRSLDADLDQARRDGFFFRASLLTGDRADWTKVRTLCLQKGIRRIVLDDCRETCPGTLPAWLRWSRSKGGTTMLLFANNIPRSLRPAPSGSTRIRLALSAPEQRTLDITGPAAGEKRRREIQINEHGMELSSAKAALPARVTAPRPVVRCVVPYSLLCDENMDIIRDIIKPVAGRYPRCEFIVDKEPYHSQEKYLVAPVTDVALLAATYDQYHAWAGQGMLRCLNDAFERGAPGTYDPASLDVCRVNGGLYGLPRFIDTPMLYCNRGILRKYGFGIPATWDDLARTVRTIRARERDPDLKGLVFESDAEHHIRFMQYLWALGGDVLDARGKIVVHNEAGARTLTFFRDLFAEPGMTAPMQDDDERTIRMFCRGKALFMHCGTDGYFWALRYGGAEGMDIAPCIMPPPAGHIHDYLFFGQALTVPANTRYPDIGKELIRAFTDLQPVVRAHYARNLDWGLNVYQKRDGLIKNPILKEQYQHLARQGRLLPMGNPLAQLYTLLNKEIWAVINGHRGIKTALQRMHRQLWLHNRKYRYTSLIEQVAAYLESHAKEPVSIKTLAQRHSISMPHLNQLFRTTMGCSCKEYQLNVRIRRAGNLLRTTTLPIHEIAARVGYANPYVFSRTFKKKTGYSPQNFRSALRQAEL